MDTLDLIVIIVAVIAAVGGYRLGFFGRVASWLGLALGFYVAIRILPSVLIRLTDRLARDPAGGGRPDPGRRGGHRPGARAARGVPAAPGLAGGPVQQADRVVGAGTGSSG